MCLQLHQCVSFSSSASLPRAAQDGAEEGGEAQDERWPAASSHASSAEPRPSSTGSACSVGQHAAPAGAEEEAPVPATQGRGATGAGLPGRGAGSHEGAPSLPAVLPVHALLHAPLHMTPYSRLSVLVKTLRDWPCLLLHALPHFRSMTLRPATWKAATPMQTHSQVQRAGSQTAGWEAAQPAGVVSVWCGMGVPDSPQPGRHMRWPCLNLQL